MVEFLLVRHLDVEHNMVAVVKYFDIWKPTLHVFFLGGKLKKKNNFPSFSISTIFIFF